MTDYKNITPTSDEIAAAQLSYLNWERSEAEEMAEYVSRRRTVELADLISEIIDNDLNVSQREVIKKYWYEKKSIPRISKETHQNKSSVSRTLDNAYKKIEVLLRYAVMYQYNIKQTDFLPAAVREAFMFEGKRHFKPEKLGERLTLLRNRENMSIDLLSRSTGIFHMRLEDFERGLQLPTAEELVKLSSYFGVTSDYILKGESNEQKES